MQKIKRLPSLVVIIGILFVTGLTFTSAFRSENNKLGVPTVLGDEEERDEEKDEFDNDSEDSDGGDEIDKEDEENDNGDKDNDEEKSTKARRANTAMQRTATQNVEKDQKVEKDDEGEDKNENENDGDLQEEIQDLNKDIKKVESRISALSANGIVVTAFAPVLSEIKSLAVQAQTAVSAKSAEAETLIETADHKLERLNKLVKMTLGDEDENDDNNDATEEIQDLAKKVAKIEVTLNSASEKGVDVSAIKLSLNVIYDLLGQAKEKVTAGDLAGAEALTEVADKKLEALKHAMESAFGDDDAEDRDEADEYKSVVAQFVHNLKEIGDIDGGIGQQVSLVAQAQNSSIAKMEELINEVEDRKGFVKFLVGPKYGSLSEIQTVVTENQTRIKVLTDFMNQLTDPAVKLVLRDQITSLNQQNAKLQTFVTESESGVSLFGWLVKMFS